MAVKLVKITSQRLQQ